MKKIDNKLSLEDIGYIDYFDSHYKNRVDENLTPARIIAEHKEMFMVSNGTSELSAKITGKMMYAALSREDYPAVGDWVLINIINENEAIIREILPRRTILKRKAVDTSDIQIIASNVDTAFTVQRGDRIAQMVIAPIIKAEFEEVIYLRTTKRGEGGFGSTGFEWDKEKTIEQDIISPFPLDDESTRPK